MYDITANIRCVKSETYHEKCYTHSVKMKCIFRVYNNIIYNF